MIQYSKPDELQDFVERAINESPSLLDRVRKFLNEHTNSASPFASLSDARVRNWREGKTKEGEKRGIPDLLTIGAALLMLADENDLYPNAKRTVPQDLRQVHTDAVLRTGLWGRAVWHIFDVADNSELSKQDVKVWRFWEGVRTVDDTPRSFAHNSLVEGEVFDAGSETWANDPPDKSLPSAQSSTSGQFIIDTIHNRNSSSLMFLQDISADTETDFGYWFTAKNAIKTIEEGNQTHEFLGGVNAIPVQNSYYVMSIAPRLLGNTLVPLLAFAPLISPLAFIEELVHKARLDRALDPSDPIHKRLQPWGQILQTNLVTNAVTVPERLTELLSEDLRGRLSGKIRATNRLVLFAKVPFPQPLLYHSFVYRLREKGIS